MILYYTAGQKTKIFAEALGNVLQMPLYRLETLLDNKGKLQFLIHALYLAVTGKGYPISNMPALAGVQEIYLCSPIWAGRLAGPAWYFLNHAPLENKTVNLLLTCANPDKMEEYRKKALDDLKLIDCAPGGAAGFITSGGQPEKDVIVEQLRSMLPFRRG